MKEKSEHTRINIHISKKAHTQAKIICALEEITLNDYFERAISNALKQDKHKLKEVFDDDK
jgi:predicted HicB family RNase H-like nuclease